MAMKVKTDRGTEACIAVETACAAVYSELSARFPEAEGLWRELSNDERDHAAWLSANKSGVADELIDFFNQESMPFINEALECAKDLKSRIKDNDLNLEDALRMSLELEKNTVEGYFWDVLTGETDMRTVGRLKQLIEKEKSHGRKIAGFMSEKGIIHNSFKPEIPAA